jgi:hypothetical protein
LPAVFPVAAQVWIEGTDFALDLHEAGDSGFVVARKPDGIVRGPLSIVPRAFEQVPVQTALANRRARP